MYFLPDNLLEYYYLHRYTATSPRCYVNRTSARVLKMAPHGKRSTPEVKEMILKLSHEGYSHAKISEATGKSRQTISKMIQRSMIGGNEENSSGRGRMKKTSVRNDRTLFQSVRKKQKTDFE